MNIRNPVSVIPQAVGDAVAQIPYWFVIGGHAVRCFCPYRPSRDVDFGVNHPRDLKDLVSRLKKQGNVEILERGKDTVHLRFEGIDISIFVLELLKPFVEDRRLTPEGVLATKLHAILDRGVRRDFFDLYVTMQKFSIGIAECLATVRLVFRQEVNDALLLRALTYFDDAEREAPLPGEGPDDWATVKGFFITRVGNLLVPPRRELEIQKLVVDVREGLPLE